MGLAKFKERRLTDRRQLTGLLPGRLIFAQSRADLVCRPVDVSVNGLGIVVNKEIDPGTALEGTRLGTPQPDGPSPAAYVCRDRTCFPKASDPAGLRALLAAPRP
jgi:hypothetical protein